MTRKEFEAGTAFTWNGEVPVMQYEHKDGCSYIVKKDLDCKSYLCHVDEDTVTDEGFCFCTYIFSTRVEGSVEFKELTVCNSKNQQS
jgi:hypothetical protein